MRCDFVGPESDLWSRFLAETPHDFYHVPKYVTLSASDRLNAPDANGRALAFHAADDQGNQFLVPSIVRPLPQWVRTTRPLFDAIAPYGYACPLVKRGSVDSVGPFLDQAIAELAKGLQQQSVISLFVRSHPTLMMPHEPLEKLGCFVRHGETICIDLTLSLEELWHQTRAGHRSEINRARKKGFTVEIQPDWKDFDEFFRGYTETMTRVGASEHYFFSREYFQNLREALSDTLHLAICHKEGAVACGALFTEVCGVVQYHLSGTTDQFHSQYPTKVLLDSVRTWAKERGNTVMHLGGGYGSTEDSLFLFKAGFSHLRTPFYTWRLMSDAETYQDVCRQWEERTQKTASPIEGFFPAYRAT